MITYQITQTDPGARARVIKLGLDVHASLIVVVRQVDQQASQPPQRFSEEAFIGFVNRQLAQAESVHSCYEAGPFGYVLHRRLVRSEEHTSSHLGISYAVFCLQKKSIRQILPNVTGVHVGLSAVAWSQSATPR